jgi:hypothetical protein
LADLKTEHKQFIVQELARFRPHSEIIKLLHAVFEVQVTFQQVYNYDPTKAANDKRVAKNLRQLFDETRKAFIGNPNEHEVSSQAYRIGRLQRMSEKAEALGNSGLAASLLEQAAKDIGGQYTNKVKVQVQDKRERLAELVRTKKEQLPETIH